MGKAQLRGRHDHEIWRRISEWRVAEVDCDDPGVLDADGHQGTRDILQVESSRSEEQGTQWRRLLASELRHRLPLLHLCGHQRNRTCQLNQSMTAA
jgi:hypothetical protein